MPRRTQPSAQPESPVRDEAADVATNAAVGDTPPGVPRARRSPTTRRSSVPPRRRRGSGEDELESPADERLTADDDVEAAAVEADAAAAEAVAADAVPQVEDANGRDEAHTHEAARALARARVSRA